MVLEAEIKVALGEFRASCEKTLRAGGGVEVGEVMQEDLYLAHPGHNFARSDEALRLRMEGNRAFLTYKGPKLDPVTKTREELEVSVGDGEKTLAILERLGFRPIATVRKRRRHFLWHGMDVYLDDVEGVGNFLEIEVPAARDIEAARQRLLGALEELGLRGKPMLRQSYLELLLQRRGEDRPLSKG